MRHKFKSFVLFIFVSVPLEKKRNFITSVINLRQRLKNNSPSVAVSYKKNNFCISLGSITTDNVSKIEHKICIAFSSSLYVHAFESVCVSVGGFAKKGQRLIDDIF